MQEQEHETDSFSSQTLLFTNVAHHPLSRNGFEAKSERRWLLCVPGIAGDDVTLVVGRPLVDNSAGRAPYGSDSWDVQQSAKAGLALEFEHRHWFANRFGIQLDYNRTSTNAVFNSLSFDSSLSF